jgi:hypothetical protein
MAQCLLIDIESGDSKSLRPWFEDRLGQSNTPFPTLPFAATVPIATDPTITALLAPTPTPNVTPPFAASYPVVMLTMVGVATLTTFTLLKFPYLQKHNPALEDEGYIGHKDEEGDRES